MTRRAGDHIASSWERMEGILWVQTRAKSGLPFGVFRRFCKSKNGLLPVSSRRREHDVRELTWSLVLLEGVIDEREVSHNGGSGFLGTLHQVTLLETFVVLLDGVAGEGDVLRGAVLTGLFQGL